MGKWTESERGPGAQVGLQIQICSDIHLDEIESDLTFLQVVEPKAPVLCLAGDIGNPFSTRYVQFLQDCATHFEHVVVVAGNHEFYNPNSMTQTIERIELLCGQYANVHFLEKKHVDIKGLRFVGTTLWSHIPKTHLQIARDQMNDYKWVAGGGLTPETTNSLHEACRSWLQDQMNEAQTGNATRLVVVSHHAPTMKGTSAPRYDTDDLRFCYRSQMEHIVGRSCNVTWICGHTHFSFARQIHGTLLISNQFQSRRYNKSLVVHIQAFAKAFFTRN
jgi:predicted phosphodiesterase